MYSTLPQMIYQKSQEIPELNIQFSKDTKGNFIPTTYKDFAKSMLDFSAGLISIGEQEYSHIGLICDNRKEWLTCSMGIMAIKSCDIPRGSEATVKDLAYTFHKAQYSSHPATVQELRELSSDWANRVSEPHPPTLECSYRR